MREILIGAADQSLFQPLWSERILEEWARAARKIGPTGEMQARGEIALLTASWPDASVRAGDGLEARLYLPDENDIHVLAAAIAGSADAIITMNAKDFPRATLAEEGLKRIAPDELLMQLWQDAPDQIETVVRRTHRQAEAMMAEQIEVRALLKKARLPRLGKVFRT